MAKRIQGYGGIARERQKKRRSLRQLMLILMVAAIILGGVALWSSYIHPSIESGSSSESEAAESEKSFENVMPAADSGGDAAVEPADLPQQQEQQATPLPQVVTTLEKSQWNTSTPVAQTLSSTYNSPDWRMTALHRAPAVDASYFDTATFVGDSLTQGLQLYDTGLPNAHYCAYRSIGPDAIVNQATLTRADGQEEICLDALVASQPDYVYMLLGTNSLVTAGNDESFLNYYGAMIDLFQENLAEGVIYYIQAIPGVAADVVQSKAGLDNARIRSINSRLAQLALEKGCYFIDLQEALSDNDGIQREEYAAADGIHYNADGYQAWVDYLATHTAYHKRNPYVNGNPYYIDAGTAAE